MFKKSLTLAVVFFGLMIFAQDASAFYTAVPGDLLRTASDATVVVVMDDLTRVPISADAYAMRYNNNFSLIKRVTTEERGSYNSSTLTINAMMSLPNGTVYMHNFSKNGIYVIDNGFKRLFTTWSGFEGSGHDFNDVEWVGPYTVYPTGPPVQ